MSLDLTSAAMLPAKPIVAGHAHSSDTEAIASEVRSLFLGIKDVARATEVCRQAATRAIQRSERRLPHDYELRALSTSLLTPVRDLALRAIATWPGEAEGYRESHLGTFWLDAMGAKLLDELGMTDAAHTLVTKGRRRWEAARAQPDIQRTIALWRPWQGDPPAFVEALAIELWKHSIRSAVEHSRPRPDGRHVCAIPDALSSALALAACPGRRLVERPDGRWLTTADGEQVAKLGCSPGLSTCPGTLDRGVELLGSLTAHRLLRWLLATAHSRWLGDDPEPRRLSVPGGFSGLATAIGARSRKAAGELRALVTIHQQLQFHRPDGSWESLLSYRECNARRGRPAALVLTLNDMLLPTYVNSVRSGGRGASEARRLVPVLRLPPFVGALNTHGRQATLQVLLISYMRRRARELALHDGVFIDEDSLHGLAATVGLSAESLSRLWDRWGRDGAHAPALLASTGPDRYALGPAYRAEWQFLVEAGRRELAGARAGRASGVARRKRSRLRTRLSVPHIQGGAN